MSVSFKPYTNTMKKNQRHYSTLDQFCLGLDQALRAVSGATSQPARPYPAHAQVEAELSVSQRQHVAGLMRVNHAGEVAAQALYHGQALFSRDPLIQAQMQAAAIEEGDHLAWCQTRLVELGSHTSYLNPLWYAGSFVIGMVAGCVGDKWSLGFVAETETQVVKHIDEHLQQLPEQDQKTAQVLEQMKADEALHRDTAIENGAAQLPLWIKKLMALTSKVMVKTAYWV